MTIKLNEYDKRLLSQITPASKWDKLKSIYAINSVIKQLKIGNKKIGLKCAKHLQKLSKQNTTSLQEIKEGCRDLKIPKQKIPLAKDKTKREVESVHKINKATDKAPTDKTKSGGRKGGGGGGGGKAQPQADLIGGLFTAFKAQEAKQARDAQYNQLDAERRQNMVNQQIPQGAAGDALRQRMQGPAAQQYLDALKEASSITGLSQGERLLYQQLLYDRDIAGQAQLYNVSGDYSMKSESVNLLNQLENKIYRAREQDLTGFNLPPTPRSVFTASSQISSDSGSGIGLFAPLGTTPQTSLQSEVKKKSFESEKLRNIDDTFKQINEIRTQVEQGVKEGKITPKEASEGLQKILEQEQVNEAMKASTETIKMQTNIIDDIQKYNKLAAPKEAQENLGFQSLTKKLQNRESELEKNRLLNQLIINGREEKQKQIENTLGNLQLGVMDRVSGLAERKENRQEQIDLLRTRMQNQSVEQQETQGFTFNPPTNPDLSSIQQNVLTNVEDRLEQQNADRAMREFISRQNLNEFNQQVQPLGLTRTSSSSLLERMEADSLRQAKENQDLQRTLSGRPSTSQDLDVDAAKKKLREQQESEAIFNRKQQELAQEIKNLKTEPPLMAFGEEDNITAKPIEKKKSPRDDESPPSELPSEEMLEFMYRTDYSQQQIEDMEQEKKYREEKQKQQDEDDYAFFEEHYDQGHDDGGQQIKYLERSLKEYRNTGKIEYDINNDEEDHEEQVEEFKKINPQELKTLIELTDKLDNTFGYDYGSYKDYGEKVYKDTLKSKKELYDYAKSINVDIDKLTGTQSSAYDTIDNLIPDLDL